MELEGSLPHSQQPDTCSYPEPNHQAHPSLSHFSGINFNIIPPSTTYVFQVVYFFQVSLPNTLYAPFLSTVPKHSLFISLFLIKNTIKYNIMKYNLYYTLILTLTNLSRKFLMPYDPPPKKKDCTSRFYNCVFQKAAQP